MSNTLLWIAAVTPFAACFAAALLIVATRPSADRTWRTADTGLAIALTGALACAIAAIAIDGGRAHEGRWLRLDVASLWLLLLANFLALVIGRFARRYLVGEPGERNFVASLLVVLAGVNLLALANHWLLLISAWAAVAAAMHRLLLFYPQRPFAALAAHKKFLADRLADALLVAAAILASRVADGASFMDLHSALAAGIADPTVRVAAVMLVLAVVLRTALLPVHGWLIQVMEAPTPVSALLHAGVINLGGFVLVRLASLLAASPEARALLIVIGAASAVLAGFVMLTRISVKVRLAWSTCAQMGFMVLECGLGLYQLALLHIAGHSLYKAHAFLTAGNAVRATRLQRLAPYAASVHWAIALIAPIAAFAVLAGMQLLVLGAFDAAWPWWWTAIAALGFAPLLWRSAPESESGPAFKARPVGIAIVAGCGALALAWHSLSLVEATRGAIAPDGVLVAAVLTAFVMAYAGVFAVQHPALALRMDGLRRACFAGFYLDEAATRLTWRLFPPRLPTGPGR